jgi:hypothetical protein
MRLSFSVLTGATRVVCEMTGKEALPSVTPVEGAAAFPLKFP